MTDTKLTDRTAAPLTVTGYEPAGYARTKVSFSDGSTAIMIEVDRSGFSRSEARRVYGENRTEHLPGNCLEVAIPEATDEQWGAFQQDLLEDARRLHQEEEQHRLEMYQSLQVFVEGLRADFTIRRIQALDMLKEACAKHGLRYMFSEYAPTI